jgi:protein-S-isoprenylcysteine O-methyltransferase Ste14
MPTRAPLLKPAVWGFYVVVVLEFLFMISPAALHFYSAYGPVLNAFHRSPWTSWLTGFFLPHFSHTANPVLDALKPAGFLLGELGLLLFVVGAVQIYGAKVLRRGAVTGGLYRWVRHPQYSALIVLGLGIVLIWPRFLVLLSFLTMLFLYHLLARHEERQCVARYGDAHRDYQARTGMFLPRPLVVWIPGPDPARPIRWRAVAAGYGLTLVAGTVLGFALQSYSLDQVSSLYTESAAVLSPAVLTDTEIRRAYRLARSDEELARRLSAAGPEARLLVYVVPRDWYLPDLPLHTIDEIRRTGGGHHTPELHDHRFQVLVTRARLHGRTEGKDIARWAYGRDPILIVQVDTGSGSVLGRKEAPDHVVWGDIPTPLY